MSETIHPVCATTGCKLDTHFIAIRALQAQIIDWESTLRSIAANTCCESCQEAALVANEALKRYEAN